MSAARDLTSVSAACALYSWVPGISPKFLKPPGYDCLVFLCHQIIPICYMLAINRCDALRTTRFPNCFALTAIR
jgi:hypothetical protein